MKCQTPLGFLLRCQSYSRGQLLQNGLLVRAVCFQHLPAGGGTCRGHPRDSISREDGSSIARWQGYLPRTSVHLAVASTGHGVFKGVSSAGGFLKGGERLRGLRSRSANAVWWGSFSRVVGGVRFQRGGRKEVRGIGRWWKSWTEILVSPLKVRSVFVADRVVSEAVCAVLVLVRGMSVIGTVAIAKPIRDRDVMTNQRPTCDSIRREFLVKKQTSSFPKANQQPLNVTGHLLKAMFSTQE